MDGATGARVEWQIIGAGSIVLSALVLWRMAVLLNVVRGQAVSLSALACSDALTGIANRRTWDHELSRACQSAREAGTRLHVALLDLDHFTDYNDTLGHVAGDRLLREATSIWSGLLGEGELLARYGGEEFVILF